MTRPGSRPDTAPGRAQKNGATCSDPVNILIVKPSSLGDIVHTFPAVGLLRACFPEAHIAWVVNDSLRQLVQLCPSVDRLLVFQRSRWGDPRRWPELVAFGRELRERRYDVALDFQGLLRSGLITAASGARRRVGFSHAREGAALFYSERVVVSSDMRHAVDKNLALVRAALPVTGEPTPTRFVTESACAARTQSLLMRHGVQSGDTLVTVVPSGRWQSKVWPASYYAEVIDRVARRLPSAKVCLVGAAAESETGEAVADACREAAPISLMGDTDLAGLVELYRHTSALLANDSGPMHLAAAAGVPVVALFGPTDPAKTGPYGEGHVVFNASCNGTPCMRRECPHPPAACHRAVSAEDVADAVVAACRRHVLTPERRDPAAATEGGGHNREESP